MGMALSPGAGQVTLNIVWGDTTFADATVIHGDTVWPVHRVVLCNKSTYFAMALGGPFPGTEERSIDLTEPFSAECVENTLKFIYGCGYPATYYTIDDHMEMFAAGDYFQVASLRDDAMRHAKSCLLDKLQYSSAALWEAARDIVICDCEEKWGGRHYCSPLYRVVLDFCYANFARLIGQERGEDVSQDISNLRELIHDCPDFGTDILLRLAGYGDSVGRPTGAYDDHRLLAGNPADEDDEDAV